MKYLFFIILLLLTSTLIRSQDNLIDASSWVVGTGSVTGFSQNGKVNESERVLVTDPYGSQSVVWKMTPDGIGATTGHDGGYISNGTVLINHNTAYRFTVWMKKTNSFDGSSVLRANIYDSNNAKTGLYITNGTLAPNPILVSSDVPQLDKWYLYVGFVHGSSYSNTNHIGGIYDPATGQKVVNGQDYKFMNTAERINLEVYIWSSGNASDELFSFAPSIYEVNGQEPSIQQLLNGSSGTTNPPVNPPTNPSTSSLWSQSGPDINYTSGNVGIGTTNPTAKLEVYGGGDLLMKGANNDAGDLVFQTNSALQTGRIWSRNDGLSGLYISSGDNTADISISDIGNIGIGTNDAGTYKLAVNGNIRAKEIKVETGWADYVFQKDYNLPTLEEVEQHIKEKGHLINIPSAKEVEENGIELGEMNKLLLEKIEELTLYIIKQDNDIKSLKRSVELINKCDKNNLN